MSRTGVGPIPSRIMLVGEAYGENEERLGEPFVGASGQELNRMLHEAGIMRSECYVTNLINQRPPNNDLGAWIAMRRNQITDKHVLLKDKMVLPLVVEGFQSLQKEIAVVKPNVILAFGNWAMWALTGRYGITKWRGSMLQHDWSSNPPVVIPTFHPAAVMRQWDWRATTVNDMRRAKRFINSREIVKPEWKFHVRPTFQQAIDCLARLEEMCDTIPSPIWIDLDLETRAGHIACAALSWSKTEAFCFPFMCVDRKEGYWIEEEEIELIQRLRIVLTHPNVRVRGQNLLYDCQYTWRHWHFVPRVAQDTMIASHSCFAALPKALHFLASMHAEYYVYWKDEGKNWAETLGEDQLWRYNCMDDVYTREVGESLTATIERLGLKKVDEVQQQLFWPVLRAMQLGVRIIDKERTRLTKDIQEELSRRETFLYDILGHQINVGSPIQMQKLFYEDLKQKVILKKKRVQNRWVYSPTTDDDALTKSGRREPLLRPVCNAVADMRTLKKWNKDFVGMKTDPTDGRMRCSFNIAGDAEGDSAPYSYRLSSSMNAFGSGGNLQTIPSDKSKSAGKAAARGTMSFDLPNIRSMFGPDSGYTFFDVDLDRADLHVFVWEIGDEIFKEVLRKKVDTHLFHVYLLDGKEPPPLEELVETHPKYWDHRGPLKHKREFSKVFCHATDYLGSSRTVAEHTARSVHEIDRAQRIYLGAHPRIPLYWEELKSQVMKRRYVENRFGYRWYIFDRLETVLPDAVAWIPQSSVGCVINRIWINLHNNATDVQTLLQVHDSLAGQFPTSKKESCIQSLEQCAKIVIPYDDPLIIPAGIKTSEVSWGACE